MRSCFCGPGYEKSWAKVGNRWNSGCVRTRFGIHTPCPDPQNQNAQTTPVPRPIETRPSGLSIDRAWKKSLGKSRAENKVNFSFHQFIRHMLDIGSPCACNLRVKCIISLHNVTKYKTLCIALLIYWLHDYSSFFFRLPFFNLTQLLTKIFWDFVSFQMVA